ncbi:MAG: nicotinate-nucleotide--dimethylbenzimidazole phosphoribosyltransferase [Vulcanimicrobiaceae bacterium]
MTAEAAREAIVAIDVDAARAARARIDALTKPPGSLGRIEALAVTLCAIAGRVVDRPYVRKAVLIGAGDHGIAADGVSAYPPEVTPQMIATFLSGHAAISAFARVARADVYVANFGVRASLAPHPALIGEAVGAGTANFASGPAMSPRDVERALAAGFAAFDAVLARDAYDVVALGEMGIGNTTSAAAVVAACTGASAEATTGRGTGIDDARLARKARIVATAVGPLRDAPWAKIAGAVGGYEIVGLAGAILAGAARRVPLVLDGYIVAAAALLAARIAPASLGYCIAAHRSSEPGHRIALSALGLEPLFDLDLRLGEGSGAALALPLVEAASRMIVEMRTFAEAGVSDATGAR